MQIQLENPEGNTIDAYSENQIQINGQVYNKSLLVSSSFLDTELNIKNIEQLDYQLLKKHIDELKPEIILIGHQQSGKYADPALMAQLAAEGIGLEAMSLDAACRTYNILVGEYRKVLAYLLF